jgi:tetratricopeptide (TPR) repeat protein
MSHSVLVETARRFVTAFYGELVKGDTVAQAMLEGQTALFNDAFRLKTFAGDLSLQDWFVPVLYQERADPQLVRGVPGEQVKRTLAEERTMSVGDLPAAPPHGFVGRSQELLVAERMLERHASVVIRGEGGEGKTALAAELARWMVASGQIRRAAFVAFDIAPDARSAVLSLVEQLASGERSKGAQGDAMALQVLRRALEERGTLIVLDNLESVLTGSGGNADPEDAKTAQGVLELMETLTSVGGTRLVLTSREAVPGVLGQYGFGLGRLSTPDATALVGRVLGESMMPGAADAVQSEEQVEELVVAVGGHARALVLLTEAAKERGVSGATDRIRELMEAMHERCPDNRQRSLLASVQLSLDRLSPEVQRMIRPLAVVQGGVSLTAIVPLLELKKEQAQAVAAALVSVGLAEPVEGMYLRLDPALGVALASSMQDEALKAARERWEQVMGGLAAFLSQQQHRVAASAYRLARLEMPNLLAALEYAAETGEPEFVTQFASIVEGLAGDIGQSKALRRASAVRTAAAGKLEAWSHAVFVSASAGVDRLLESGRMTEAEDAAQRLLERCLRHGEQAFSEAAYDTAAAQFRLGRVLNMGGAAAAALKVLVDAKRRFVTLAASGDEDAGRMASVADTQMADCLRGLGRLEEAARLYEDGIKAARVSRDMREVAVGLGQLGSVRLLQKRPKDALELYQQAKTLFEELREPSMVAVAWHQIAMTYKEARQYAAAEQAYQESFKIEVQVRNRGGEAATLLELGNLHVSMLRPEEAVRLFGLAAEIFHELSDPASEGSARNNAALTLVGLGRYTEARPELAQAIECSQRSGHAAEPWKTLAILHKLESAQGHAEAAAVARSRAASAYLAYRRDGGQNLSGAGRIFELVSSAISEGKQAEAAEGLDGILAGPDCPDYLKALIPALKRVLAGARDLTLADDSKLDYDDAAELRLLLERLGGAGGPQS